MKEKEKAEKEEKLYKEEEAVEAYQDWMEKKVE